jgi:hypothetical protein
MRHLVAWQDWLAYGGCAVPEYRFYELTEDGHIVGPPALIELADDEAAVAEAEKRLYKTRVEIWQRDRRVIQLRPK